MSGWQPIATYDKLKKKPELAVFWFRPVKASKYHTHTGLRALIATDRFLGSRVCVYWMPLPEPPEQVEVAE